MAEEEYFWRTDDPLIFRIGGEEISLDKKGRDYAEQFGNLTAWLGTYGLSGIFSAYEAGIIGEDGSDSDVEMLVSSLSHIVQSSVGPDAMIELGSVLIGRDKDFVEEHFDPGWFVDALVSLIDNKPGIKGAFVRLWQRFFLAAGDSAATEEDQASD
jgi:hypothetical protein